jgi:hypothetical protein
MVSGKWKKTKMFSRTTATFYYIQNIAIKLNNCGCYVFLRVHHVSTSIGPSLWGPLINFLMELFKTL